MLRRNFAALAFPAAGYKPSNPVITHEVLNQAPYFENYNTYDLYPRLHECSKAYGVADKYGELFREVGKSTGSAYWLNEAHISNKAEPVFTPFDRQGRRINQATLDETYHRLMAHSMKSGITGYHYTDKANGHLANSIIAIMMCMLEQGTSCPTNMTAACVSSLELGGSFFQPYIDKMIVKDYDNRDIHLSLKRAATCGMSMTEKQGGSDVRQNTTWAVPLTEQGSEKSGAMYHITGHKWFTSAPMSDVFLTLAYTSDNKISCFLIPRWLAPNEPNVGLRFQRLKNKMGDKSNASSEVEYNQAVGYLLGWRGDGVRTIIQMVNYTRLMCMVGSTGISAIAVSNAIHHTAHRNAFGGVLVEKPLMQNVLCDMIFDIEANIAFSTRVAHSFDQQSDLSDEYMRIAVSIGKYMSCKRSAAIVNEAMECMGGNGYLEDFPLARLFRQSPLNAIWEGSGNVIVLDMFRAFTKSPATLNAIMEDIKATQNPILIKELEDIVSLLKNNSFDELEMIGRSIVERLGVVMQAAALYHSKGDMAIYEAYVGSRVGPAHCARGMCYGTLESKYVNPDFIKRNMPKYGL